VYMDRDDPTRLYRKQVFTKQSKSLSITTQPPEKAEVVDNESIFCLAVALLELTFGAPLSNFHLGPNVVNADDRLTQLITAKRLTKSIRKHEEERYVVQAPPFSNFGAAMRA